MWRRSPATHCKNASHGRTFGRDDNGDLAEASCKDSLLHEERMHSSWKTLISRPDFTWKHLLRSFLRDPTLTLPRIAYDYSYYVPGDICNGIGILSVQTMLDNPSEPTKVAHFRAQISYRIIGSCHGLLCLLDDDYGSCGNMHVLLWNPCTGFTFQSQKIIRDYHRGGLLCGFGYDHLSDTYKFLGIMTKIGTSGLKKSTRIYTFGPTSSWRRIDDDIPYGLLPGGQIEDPGGIGVYVGNSRTCTLNWSDDHMVLYFDLGKETYDNSTLDVDSVADEGIRRCSILD
ncbi:hypothetical protein PIB30_003106 [Stylosanthes scabra]|uniref:F-box associated beta-propeller type 3 domain-containing protein n=1 Tax=Stylosanthes scabra TaxID=79078 RepID=A0ABU6Y0K4_9FABA|nr:hypothetical protein [Stylosanthes scabra]